MYKAFTQEEFEQVLVLVKRRGGGEITLGPGIFRMPDKLPDNVRIIGA
jgi:hypothetical protein